MTYEVTMYRKSIANMISNTKPCESYQIMENKRLDMPMPDDLCDLCGNCAKACSGHAINVSDRWSVDLGKCVFCRDCYDVCEHIVANPAPHYALKREDLIFFAKENKDVEGRLSAEKTRGLKNSVAIRELDTGSCNACENEANAMSNKYYDMTRFGIEVKPSPRHADALLVTGPMTRNMLIAAKKTYDAVPENKLVIACGTCAISGGLFVDGDVVGKGINDTLPVDIYVIGCPPTPNGVIITLIKALGLRH
jgi:hydrogenase-4 component I